MSKDGNSPFFKAPRYLLRKQNILRLLKNHPEIKSFLDVGCGAGELACSLAQQGLEGVGIDFSEEAIGHAESIHRERKLSKKQLKFEVGGLEAVANRKFDLVICCEVLEHIKDDKQMLRQLLKNTGKYLLLSVPAKQKLFDASDTAVGHFRRYEKADLHRILKEANLEILHFINYGYPYTDLMRTVRKTSFKKKLRQNAQTSMETRSKESGVNPVKLPTALQRMNIEPFMKPLYLTTLPFNNFNLSDSFLVLCKRNQVN